VARRAKADGAAILLRARYAHRRCRVGRNSRTAQRSRGEGAGLGLSISHDIIVKQHGGSIEVNTQPGEFTEIKITLPRSDAFPTEPAAHA